MFPFRLHMLTLQNVNSLAILVRKSPIFSFYQSCFSTQVAARVAFDPDLKLQSIGHHSEEVADILRRWGCSESDISKMFLRSHSLCKMKLSNLQMKLNILGDLGITSTDLVRILNCRPSFLNYSFKHCMNERFEYLQSLFGSRETLVKAIVRNPSLLLYDIGNRVKPVVALYERMGIGREDLVLMLLSRPTLIARTSLNDEKLDYIRRIGVLKDSKMYKYVVSLVAISRIETLREKMTNFEKFGFSEDEFFCLIRRSPLILTLSIDKVQRNMTFMLGTMKLPASVVLDYPFLLFSNLETLLRPRFLLAGKIRELCLVPRIEGHSLFRAFRMNEKRFILAFVECHPEDIAKELMEYYSSAKCVKRLALTSKNNFRKGFPL